MEDSFPQLRLVSTVVLSILTYIWLDSYPPTYINVLSQVVVHLGMYAFFSFNFFVSTSAKGKLANYDFSRQSLSDSNAKGEFLALLFGVTSRNAHFIYFSQSKIRTAE